MTQYSSDKRLTIRFTQEEYALLQAKAGDKALSAFVRDLSLDKAQSKRKTTNTAPIKDHVSLAQILALLGKSGISSEFSALNEAVKLGFVDLDEEAKNNVQIACDDLGKIKSLLMHALRVQEQWSWLDQSAAVQKHLLTTC